MARTFGGVSTDAITTGLTSQSNARTFACWMYRTGGGGNGAGRVFSKNETDTVLGSSAWATFDYSRARATTNGNWRATAPALNEWHPVMIVCDHSSTSNDPVFYIDGVAVSVTEIATPNGALTANSDPYMWGNRASDSARNFGGTLCECAVWDRLLSAEEAAAYAKGFSPAFFPKDLVSYVDLVRAVRDRKNNAALTVSGTVVADHPRIIYPTSVRSELVPNAAAASPSVIGQSNSGALNFYLTSIP